jgi:hypothetical protein
MTDRQTFFLGDSPILYFECRLPNANRYDDPDGIPAQPTTAQYRVFNGTDGEFVTDDGTPSGDVWFDAVITPMDEAADRGAVLAVHLPDVVTATSGQYTVYVTHEYETEGSEPNLRITDDFRIVVSEFR